MRGGCFRWLRSPLLFSASSRLYDAAARGETARTVGWRLPLQTAEFVRALAISCVVFTSRPALGPRGAIGRPHGADELRGRTWRIAWRA
jgi:hypothetical protein